MHVYAGMSFRQVCGVVAPKQTTQNGDLIANSRSVTKIIKIKDIMEQDN